MNAPLYRVATVEGTISCARICVCVLVCAHKGTFVRVLYFSERWTLLLCVCHPMNVRYYEASLLARLSRYESVQVAVQVRRSYRFRCVSHISL